MRWQACCHPALPKTTTMTMPTRGAHPLSNASNAPGLGPMTGLGEGGHLSKLSFKLVSDDGVTGACRRTLHETRPIEFRVPGKVLPPLRCPSQSAVASTICTAML